MKTLNATVALLALFQGLLAAQPTPTTTLATQLSICIEQELKKEWGRPQKNGKIVPGGWYPFTHVCSNVASQNLTIVIMPYTEDGDIGSSGRYTEYSTFYTAKACLEGTKDELIEQAKELIPIGKAFDLKGPRKGKNEKEASIECMAVYDSTGEVRSQINKPDPYIGWYENPDFPPWKAPVSTGR